MCEESVVTHHPAATEAPVVRPEPAWQTFVTGASVSIGCGATAYPEPTYSWRRDGSPLSPRHSVARDGTLTLRDLTAADAGRYECHATNIAGTGAGAAAIMYIGEALRH